uniref:coatomer subunit alpha-2-like n=1 Tax=Erigeron canadensis TaxID=72917 RepID=UPI001CB95CE0|nr:coatomer subunit alpha-2-like [Erigeron canadensis]
MYIKYDGMLNSAVKGLCFESKGPLILVSCENGAVKLINYELKRVICDFNRHNGKPVRSVSFERNRPFFVSGGDDYMIRVWDYQLRQCMFALSGHTGIIRTVQFHNKKPWIVSASDDESIRIWNWESRKCMSVLRGYKGHVMCALFHPDKGHEQGVNWASFHPSLPLNVSGAKDHQVKVWQMQDAKACELDTTLDGHMDIVSCVLFHDRLDTTVVSTSEDKSIRVWEATKRTGLQTFSREHDRFRILGRHPDMKLLAAGHNRKRRAFSL